MAVWDDTRVDPHVRDVARIIASTFGITNIGGFATAGHIPDSDHYKGLALDVMIGGAPPGTGQNVANWAVNNAKNLGITYVIWNRQIWDSRDGKGWVAYHGTSPHTDHVHISFYPNFAGGVQNLTGAATSAPNGCAQLLNTITGQSMMVLLPFLLKGLR